MSTATGSGKDNSKTEASKYARRGVTVAAVGFALLVLGALMVLKSLSVGTLVTELFVLLGMFLLIVGCGTFGFAWAGDWPAKSFSLVGKWSVVATFVSTVLITFMALWAYTAGNALWTAVSVGALGGLVHEIAQSKGTAFLPGSSNSQAAPAKPSKPQVPAQNPTPTPAATPTPPTTPAPTPPTTPSPAPVVGAPTSALVNADPPSEASSGSDSTATGSSGDGEDYLGGLVGIVLGGAAGLLILSTTSATVVSLTLIVTAFSAGIALKGVSDAAASPPANQTGTGKTNGGNGQT